ncbi:MAG: methyltransferase domain-containing protein, partial [Proteobacteria bacterium]|nr:methyltransferase domain-containing protein [Pseudomonadota bacterium]
ARELVGIEISESAVRDAEINCRNNGVTNCRFILGDIKDCLGQVKKPDYTRHRQFSQETCQEPA